MTSLTVPAGPAMEVSFTSLKLDPKAKEFVPMDEIPKSIPSASPGLNPAVPEFVPIGSVGKPDFSKREYLLPSPEAVALRLQNQDLQAKLAALSNSSQLLFQQVLVGQVSVQQLTDSNRKLQLANQSLQSEVNGLNAEKAQMGHQINELTELLCQSKLSQEAVSVELTEAKQAMSQLDTLRTAQAEFQQQLEAKLTAAEKEWFRYERRSNIFIQKYKEEVEKRVEVEIFIQKYQEEVEKRTQAEADYLKLIMQRWNVDDIPSSKQEAELTRLRQQMAACTSENDALKAQLGALTVPTNIWPGGLPFGGEVASH